MAPSVVDLKESLTPVLQKEHKLLVVSNFVLYSALLFCFGIIIGVVAISIPREQRVNFVGNTNRVGKNVSFGVLAPLK